MGSREQDAPEAAERTGLVPVQPTRVGRQVAEGVLDLEVAVAAAAAAAAAVLDCLQGTFVAPSRLQTSSVALDLDQVSL